MKRTNAYRLWNQPDGDMAECYRHVSYILFRTDSDGAEIVGARCPDMVANSVGRSAVDSLELDEEAQMYLFSASEYEVPLVVMTRFGVGVLDKRYDAHAGLGIYWHLHGHPDRLARLFNSGVPGKTDGGGYRLSRRVAEIVGDVTSGDLPSYRALMDGWPVVMGEVPGEWARTDRAGYVDTRDLWCMMERLAAFVGCGLAGEGGEPLAAERIRCPRPLLIEALFWVLLTEVRQKSATRGGFCRIGTLADTGMLTLEFTYPVEDTHGAGEDVEKLHRHLGWICELSGLQLQSEFLPRTRRRSPDGENFAYQRIVLEWLHDPAVLASSDIKAKIRFLYETEDK